MRFAEIGFQTHATYVNEKNANACFNASRYERYLLLQSVAHRETDRKVDAEDRQATASLHLRSPAHVPLNIVVGATGLSVNCT